MPARNVGRDYFELDTARLRYFGGTSNHWGGMCRTLDPYDFAPHAVAPAERLADRQGRPRPLSRRGARHPRSQRSGRERKSDPTGPRRNATGPSLRTFPTRRSSRRSRVSATSASATARRCASARSTAPRSQAAPRHPAGAERQPRRPPARRRRRRGDGGGVPLLRPGRPRLHGPGALLRALRRRHREPAAAARLPAARAPEGIGNRHDLVGRFFCEHPTFTVGRRDLRARRVAGDEFYAPTPAFMAEQAHASTSGCGCMPTRCRRPDLARATARSVACSADFLAALHEQVLGRPPGCGRPALGAWLRRQPGRRSAGSRIGQRADPRPRQPGAARRRA